MANVGHKLINWFGLGYEDVDTEEEIYDEQVEEEQVEEQELYETTRREVKPRKERKQANNSKVVNLPTGNHSKMIVYYPVSYDDTKNIIDNLKSRKPIIVNMESIDVAVAQRILDFISGACYALGGSVYKVSSKIFAVGPADYDIIGNSDGSRD